MPLAIDKQKPDTVSRTTFRKSRSLHASLRLLIAAALSFTLASCTQEPSVSEVPPAAEESRTPAVTETRETVPSEPAEPDQPGIDTRFEVIAARVAGMSVDDREDVMDMIRLELRTIDAKIDSFELTSLVADDDLSEETQALRDQSLAAVKTHRASIDDWLMAMEPDSGLSWEEASERFVADFFALGYAMGEAEEAFGR